jgi:hypothetical protein
MAHTQKRYRGNGKGPVVVLLLLALVTALLVPAAAMHVAAEKKAEETKQETLKKTQKKSTSSSKTTAKTAKTAKAAKKKTVTPPAPVAAAKVDASYFQGAVFIGDSRTQGLQLYSGLTTPRYLCAVGATVASIYNDSKVKTSSGKVPIMTALHQAAFSKVYIMLGVNELGWVYSKTFTNQYAKVIKDIRAINPDAKIVLQSILPVSAAQEAKHGYINNERIAAYNKLIEKLAADNSCTYLNVAEAVTASDGCLADSLTGDGLHLNKPGCQRWKQYLEAHPLS